MQALDVDPATGEVEGDEEGFPEEYPLEQLNIATADFMAKVCGKSFELLSGRLIDRLSG